MFYVVLPLLISFWAEFFIFACFSSAFFSNFFFKYSTAESLIYAMICGEWQQRTRACEWVDACVSVAMPQWLSLRGSGHASRNRVWSCMLLRGWHVWSFFSVCDDDDDHTWWLQHLHCCRTCRTWRLAWNMKYIWMRKFHETLFKQYFGSYSAAADPPPSSQALATTRWEYGRSPRSSRSRSWKVTRTGWRQLRSTRAGSTWRQVRSPDYDYEYYESIYVIENLSSIRDNDYDNYYDV